MSVSNEGRRLSGSHERGGRELPGPREGRAHRPSLGHARTAITTTTARGRTRPRRAGQEHRTPEQRNATVLGLGIAADVASLRFVVSCAVFAWIFKKIFCDSGPSWRTQGPQAAQGRSSRRCTTDGRGCTPKDTGCSCVRWAGEGYAVSLCRSTHSHSHARALWSPVLTEFPSCERRARDR